MSAHPLPRTASAAVAHSLPELLLPHLPDLSVGAILGFSAGYAIKRIGKMALLITGLLFVAVQILASQGFLSVHWDVLEARATPLLHQGGEVAWASVLRVLQTNLPFGGAFVAALLLGLRTR